MVDAEDFQDVVARFVRGLDVAPRGDNVFVGQTEPESSEWTRVFGGLVLGQAALAAGRTAPDPTLHSLHAYFLRGGEPGRPIEYRVERVRDGRTFTARRVLARQGEQAICDITASFVHPEEGISHQEPMPDVPDPESLEDARFAFPDKDEDKPWPLGPFEWRAWEPFDRVAQPGEDMTVREWCRIRAPLPDDPPLRTAALVYISDAGSFSGIERRYGWENVSHHASASLDHAMWIHRPVAWDGWMLMQTSTPVAHAARPLSYRQFFTRDGTQIASVAQEAIFRIQRSQP